MAYNGSIYRFGLGGSAIASVEPNGL